MPPPSSGNEFLRDRDAGPGTDADAGLGKEIRKRDGDVFYTNEDVALLHDIVVRAQELLPTLPARERLPTNALFNAYYEILAELGVNSDHDSRYARVLFKIGGLRSEGTLYEKFEEVLGKMGIRIILDLENQMVESVVGEEDREVEFEEQRISLQQGNGNARPRARPRRNSESTLWDLENQERSRRRRRRNSISDTPRKGDAPTILDPDLTREFPQQQLQQSNIQATAVRETDRNPRARLTSGQNGPRRPGERSVSTQASMRIRQRSPSFPRYQRPGTSASIPASDLYHAGSEDTSFTEPEWEEEMPYRELLPEQPKESEHIMKVKASIYYQHRMNFLIINILQTWRDEAIRSRKINTRLTERARLHDKIALLHPAWDLWVRELAEKREERKRIHREADKAAFFAKLEERATQARYRHIVYKAFTHWHAHALDEQKYMGAAQRHMVKFRFFNAWKDLTVANEFKVRIHVLKSFVSVWKRKSSDNAGKASFAVQIYRDNLIKKVFEEWWLKHFGLKALRKWEESTQLKALWLWIAAYRRLDDKHYDAEEHWTLQLSSKALRNWNGKYNAHLDQYGQANAHYQRQICGHTLRKWRRETQIIPAKKTVQIDVRARVLRDIFSVWLQRTRQERQAASVDRTRTIREAWTHWRHKVRLQVHRTRVDDQCVRKCLGQWVAAERLVYVKLNRDETLLRKCLLDWSQRLRVDGEKRWDHEDFADNHAVQKTQRLVLNVWQSWLQHRQQQEVEAEKFHTPIVLRRVISKWMEQSQHQLKLQQWSRDARFYFLASKSLKKWKISAELSKREKRKAAYAQVRRMMKINLARRILFDWLDKAQRIMGLQDQAADVADNKNLIVGMDIFDRWRARTEELAEMDSMWQDIVLKKYMVIWISRSSALHALNVEASIDFQETRQNQAIRKWRLKSLQVRSQETYAAEVRQKNLKRAFRKIFTYWQQRTAQKRPPAEVPESTTLDTTERVEAWSELGDDDEWAKGLEEATFSTPVPGYMSTPSKRTERVLAAAAARYSTTPRAPLSTPAERLLRAQYSGGTLPLSLRRGPGRSTLGMGEGFANINEKDDMRAVLPGKAQAKLQGVCTGYWDSRRLIAYISGNAFVILTDADTLLQTIYDDNEEFLEAIAIDEASGKIAVCAGSNIRVYKPYGQGDDALKWSLQHSFCLSTSDGDSATTLSWGIAEELVVGSAWLSLYSTIDEGIIWKRELANTVKFANFSYDSAFIASTGRYDRLVKIWRRLSFGEDDTRFDFSYLRHPATVTNMHWRRPYHLDQTIDNVLYTICTDNVLRVWVASDPHGTQILQLWASIDLEESIQPRTFPVSEVSNIRYTFIIDGRDFTKATEHAVQERGADTQKEDHALAHLIEVANRNPEICVVLDGQGHLSAWGLENIGCKTKQTTNIFNVAHVDGLGLGLPKKSGNDEAYIQIYNFCNHSGGNLNMLIHHFDGKIEYFESNVADLFDPQPRVDRFVSKAIWTGHSARIKKIVRNVSGRALVSRTDSNESIVWKHMDLEGGAVVFRQSLIDEEQHIRRICVLRKGNFVIFLHESNITLWDTRRFNAVKLADCEYSAVGKPLCILMLPEVRKDSPIAHVATITSKMKGIVWEVKLPQRRGSTTESWTNGHAEASIREFCRFDLGNSDDLSYVLPVDPAGSPPVISGFLDTFARDIAISYTHSGLLRSWTTRIDLERERVDWLETCSVETGICEPALASGSSIRKAAIVNANRSELTIWDVRGAQLEFAQDYESQDRIQDLDWTSTPDDQSILAVGFPYRVLLLSQMRYDYLNKGPAWAAIREINIRDLTPHPIGDSTWLGGGNLIIGAGNQLFVYGEKIDQSAPVVTNLGLPHLYHPQFLGQCTLAGKSALVQRVLLSLYKTLKFFVEGDYINNHLGMDLEEFYTSSETASSVARQTKSAFDNFSDDDEVETVTEDVAASINESLTKIALPQLSRQEQIHLADIVECVAIVEKQRRSMDDNAARYMMFFRQHALRRGRTNEALLSWREINWAYHSNSQDILVDMISRQFHGKLLWGHARESGMFMWMTDNNALKFQFEVIARNEYTKTDMKNPIDCSLFYLALKKKTVLQGLWRMAGWNREQSATTRLLSNNFSDPKWRTAAMKNAYALLGKHRHEYAAAFFLLADCLKDAVNVILNQLKDLQLALAVTRVYEGEHGPVLKELLEEKVLPLAAQEGNRWLASWAFWMLNRRDMAVRALISPVTTLLSTPPSPSQSTDLTSRLFLTDDPSLIILYSQLRQKTLQTLRGASKVTPKVEWTFILHSARLYDRMGCDLLALDLVRNWEFLLPVKTVFKTIGVEVEDDPRRMLRRRSSLVVADLPLSPRASEMKTGWSGGGGLVGRDGTAMHRPPPSVFEEPEASSLLDSFGF
ncbi:hypothetical protein B7494_g2375 [Chlorociboria aeruginascens]|nr:hypothetical protein B7494_g2375 [Chlorociboria aeruginascens]